MILITRHICWFSLLATLHENAKTELNLRCNPFFSQNFINRFAINYHYWHTKNNYVVESLGLYMGLHCTQFLFWANLIFDFFKTFYKPLLYHATSRFGFCFLTADFTSGSNSSTCKNSIIRYEYSFFRINTFRIVVWFYLDASHLAEECTSQWCGKDQNETN